jgi:hypothetical protein
MKKSLAFVLLATLAPFVAPAQDENEWRVDLRIDELGYTPDYGAGLNAGVAVRLGDAERRRDNLHLFDLSGGWHSEGMSEAHFMYDSRRLLPWGVRLAVGGHYTTDALAGFHGFGGASSPYYRELDRRGGVAFYGMRRDVARASLDLGGSIANRNAGRTGFTLDWKAGASFSDYEIGSVTHKKYADGAGNSLYNLYRRYGLISDYEAAGGRRAEFSAGLAFEMTGVGSTDAPHYGKLEVLARVSPDLFDRRADYAKLGVRLSHHIMIKKWSAIVSYRLGYDGTVWSQGPVPFYVQSELATPTEGRMSIDWLPGGVGSLRGVLQNRVVGDGVAWANVDVAVKVAGFRALGRHWDVLLNPFADAGAVVQPYRLDQMREVWSDTWRPASERRLVYSGVGEKLHVTAGLGVSLIAYDDYTVSVLWGRPFSRQDGPGALYAGVKWLF